MKLDLVKKEFSIQQNQDNNFEIVDYEGLINQVKKLGEYLCSVEVTPENIQENKKLVAQVRKAYDKLNQNRIQFKKEYLIPIENLENQVKEISSLVQSYEATIRVQIREIEEQEREQKRKDIEKLFNKRLRAYGSEDIYIFDDFLEKRHLNKSVSIAKVEEEMVKWFENRQHDLNALSEFAHYMPQSEEEIINQYLLNPVLSDTICHFKREKKRLETIKQAKKEAKKKPKVEPTTLIEIKDKDLEKIKQLFAAWNIDFSIV